MTECQIDGCEKGGRRVRGWCEMHYARWRNHGDPLNPGAHARHLDPEESFTARVAWDGNCLVWIGGDSGNGYGRVFVDGRHEGAHRFAYRREHGPIPEGMEVDHICHNRACCLPAHLRLATREQNMRNQSGASRVSSTGTRGVFPHGRGYRVVVAGVRYGTYPTIELAAIAAKNARAIQFGEYAGNN